MGNHSKQLHGVEKLEDRCDEGLSRLSDKNRTLRQQSTGLREKTRQEFACRTVPSTTNSSLWSNTTPNYETEFRRSYQQKSGSLVTNHDEQHAKGHGRYAAISQWGADPIFFYR